jgi:hypothetical protein
MLEQGRLRLPAHPFPYPPKLGVVAAVRINFASFEAHSVVLSRDAAHDSL